MGATLLPGAPIRVEDSDQIVPPTSRKVFVAVDENGLRIGESHPNAKLTDAQVDEIRDLHEEHGLSYNAIAEKFNIPKVTAQRICNYSRRASTIARWKVLLLHTPISLANKPEDEPK
jgi:hypothetical protein